MQQLGLQEMSGAMNAEMHVDEVANSNPIQGIANMISPIKRGRSQNKAKRSASTSKSKSPSKSNRGGSPSEKPEVRYRRAAAEKFRKELKAGQLK